MITCARKTWTICTLGSLGFLYVNHVLCFCIHIGHIFPQITLHLLICERIRAFWQKYKCISAIGVTVTWCKVCVYCVLQCALVTRINSLRKALTFWNEWEMIKPYICHFDADFDNMNIFRITLGQIDFREKCAHCCCCCFSLSFPHSFSLFLNATIYFTMQTHLFSFIFQANFAWAKSSISEKKKNDKQTTDGEDDTFADDYILQQFIEI